jgi:hypothetical protein
MYTDYVYIQDMLELSAHVALPLTPSSAISPLPHPGDSSDDMNISLLVEGLQDPRVDELLLRYVQGLMHTFSLAEMKGEDIDYRVYTRFLEINGVVPDLLPAERVRRMQIHYICSPPIYIYIYIYIYISYL